MGVRTGPCRKGEKDPEKSIMYLMGLTGLSCIRSGGLISNEEFTSLIEKIGEGIRNAEDKSESEDTDMDNEQVTRYYIDGNEIPIWEKKLLTINEASQYFSIGANKIREMTADEDCDYVVWIGSKRLIKRERFGEYLDTQYSI